MVAQDSKEQMKRGRQGTYKHQVNDSAASFAKLRFSVAKDSADHAKFLRR